MDFHNLMHVAASKQESKKSVNRYSLDLPAPKKEEKPKPKSEVVQKLIQEKQREKQEREEAIRIEKERMEREERNKNQYRIPKKTSEKAAVDIDSLIESLFDDSGVQSGDSLPDALETSGSKNHHHDSKSHRSHSSNHAASHKDRSSSSGGSTRDKHKDQDERGSDKYPSSSHHHKSSSDHKFSGASKHSEHKSGSSSSKDRGRTSSSHSSSKDNSSSSHKHKSSSNSDVPETSSSSADHKISSTHSGKNSHSSSGGSKDQSSSSKSSSSKSLSSSKHSEMKASSASKTTDVKSSTSSSKSSSGSSATVPQRRPFDEQPVVLTKHHLNPTVERQAAGSQLSEKEKILARLQAIKERTLAAIHKENDSKGKRHKGQKSHRKSKVDEKHDNKTKSAELVKEVASSDDEEESMKNGGPSVLDIMLSDRNAKLEKEKMTRLVKQAWERATRKDRGEEDKEVTVKKKHKTSHRDKEKSQKSHVSRHTDNKSNHKRKDHSLSPDLDTRGSFPRPKKPVIKRHVGHAVPPPMDYKSLLAMAEEKQKAPPKPLGVIPKKKKEPEERPKTQEEKEREERKKSKEYQDWLKHGGKPPNSQALSDEDELPTPSSSYHSKPDRKPVSQVSTLPEKNKANLGGSKQSFNKLSLDKARAQNQLSGSNNNNKHKNITVNENVLVCGPATSSGDEGSPLRSETSVNPFDRIMSQVHKKRPAAHSRSAIPSKKGRFLDSEEEEEDSELDDFIDDGDDGETDYSKEIGKIFGYNKAKYKNEQEDDLSDMEADYSTMMREEKRSAKIGMMEDLEDMRREQEELKRKAMLKKQMKRQK